MFEVIKKICTKVQSFQLLLQKDEKDDNFFSVMFREGEDLAGIQEFTDDDLDALINRVAAELNVTSVDELVKPVELEPIIEIGINHQLFSTMRHDLDLCIRRAIDEATDDVKVVVPLQVKITRDPFSQNIQIGYSICVNVTRKKNQTKDSIRGFMTRYDEKGHMLLDDLQINLDEITERQHSQENVMIDLGFQDHEPEDDDLIEADDESDTNDDEASV